VVVVGPVPDCFVASRECANARDANARIRATRLAMTFSVFVGRIPHMVLYQKTWAMTHRPSLLVLRAGLVGRPRAERDSHTKGHSQ
jgi:hypothetical protein